MARTFGAIPANEAGWPDTPPSGGGAGAAWPVGSVFLSVVSTDPATLLGVGTWTAIGAGRVLVGIDAGDTDFDTVEETGGSKTVAAAGTNSAPAFTGTPGTTGATSAGTPAGTNAGCTPVSMTSITSNDSAGTPTGQVGTPTFTGTSSQVTSATGAGTPAGTIAWPAGVPTHSGITATTSGDGATVSNTTVGGAGVRNVGGHTHTVNITSQGTVAWPAGVPTFAGTALGTHTHTLTPAGTISQPSFTGDAMSAHGHTYDIGGWTMTQPTFTGTAMATHTHTFTPAGTVAAPAFTGSATSVVQPYFVVYMWKRTA